MTCRSAGLSDVANTVARSATIQALDADFAPTHRLVLNRVSGSPVLAE